MPKRKRTRKKKINYWIIGSIATIALLLGYSIGVTLNWFSPVFTSSSSGKNDTSNYQGGGGGGGSSSGGDGSIANYWLSISVHPESVCKGDIVTGTVSSNMPSARCSIQYRFSDIMAWQSLGNIQLDNSGSYSQQAPANNVGRITFRTVCIVGSTFKVSNERSVTVSDCSTPVSYDCFDSDDGINFVQFGYCEDSYHNAGYQDGCVSGETYMREYYCDDSGICQWIPNTNWKCNQMSCEQILHPSSQASCDLGNCLTNSCTYIPATLVAPSRCGCQ